MVFDPSKGNLIGREEDLVGRPLLGTPVPDPAATYREIQDIDPGTVAEVNRVSKHLNADPIAVGDNLPAAQHAAAQPDWQEMKKVAPVLHNKAADPKFAALIKDDFDNLMKLEKAFEGKPELTFGRLGDVAWSNFKQSTADAAKANAAYWEQYDMTNQEHQQQIIRDLTVTDKPEFYRLKKEAINNGETEAMATSIALSGIKERSHGYWNSIAEDPNRQIPEHLKGPSSGIIEDVTAAMSGSALGMATTMATGPAGGAFFFNQIYGSKYRELTNRGVAPDKAADAALVSALGQAPLESAGALFQLKAVTSVLSKVGKRLGTAVGIDTAASVVGAEGFKAIGVDVLKALGLSMVGEGFEEYLQNFPDLYANVMADNPDATVAEVTAMFLQKIPETAVSKEALHSALIGSLAGGGFTGATLAVTTPGMIIKEAKAKDLQKKIEGIRSTLTNLEERDKEEYLKHVNDIAKKSGDGSFFMQGEALLQALSESGEDVGVWAERHGVTREQINAAFQTGGDVELPVANVIASMKDDQVMQSLVDDLKIRPDDASINSLGVEGENDQAAAVRLRELFDEKVREDATPEQIESLQEQIRSAAKAAGIKGYTQANVEAQTTLLLAGANRWVQEVNRARGTEVTQSLETQRDKPAEMQAAALADATDIESNAAQSEKFVFDGHQANATLSANSFAHKWYLEAGYPVSQVVATLKNIASGKQLTDQQQAVAATWIESQRILQEKFLTQVTAGNLQEGDEFTALIDDKVDDFEVIKVTDDSITIKDGVVKTLDFFDNIEIVGGVAGITNAEIVETEAVKGGAVTLDDFFNTFSLTVGQQQAHADEMVDQEVPGADQFNQAAIAEADGQAAKLGSTDYIEENHPAQFAAIQAQYAKMDKAEALRVQKNFEEHAGTLWAMAAYRSMVIKEILDRSFAGESIDDIAAGKFWSDLEKVDWRKMRIVKAFGLGEIGVTTFARSYNFFGANRKAESDFSGSFLNCDPSDACATFCYSAAGTGGAPSGLMKAEFTEFMANNYPEILADRLSTYAGSPAGMNGLALRMNEKGDLSEAQLKLIEALNKKDIRLQIFSKRPELLRRVSDFNWRSLSVDTTNMDLALENEDLQLAVIVTDDLPASFMNKVKDRLNIVLPVNLKGNSWTPGKIKEMYPDAWPEIQKALCPVDGGKKTTVPGTSFVTVVEGLKKGTGDNTWTCTACDKLGSAGCFSGKNKSETARKAKSHYEAVNGDTDQLIEDSQKAIEKQLDLLLSSGSINDEQRASILGQLTDAVSGSRKILDAGAEGSSDAEYSPGVIGDEAGRPGAGRATAGPGADTGVTGDEFFQGAADTDTEQFAAWFGESQVVDELGKPLVVHHGGFGATDIEIFDPNFGGQTTGNNEHGAFHFTENEEVAGDYSRQSFIRRFQDNPEALVEDEIITQEEFDTIEEDGDWYAFVEEKAEEYVGTNDVFLKIENPIVLDMEGERVDVAQIEALTRFAMGQEQQDGDYEYIDGIADQLDSGFDPDDVANFSEEIDQRARENFDLEEDEEIEDYQREEATQEVLEENGYEPEQADFDGIIIKNMIDDIGDQSNQIADQYIAFNSNQIKSTRNAGNFSPYSDNIFEQKGDQPRGSIQFDEGRATGNITFTPQADLSTFLHETGHFFLEMVRISAQEHGAFTEEWATIKDFLGAEDGVEITRDQHEKWAESWERYLAEGKAPTVELQSSFDKFKSWLVSIYRSIKGMPGAALSDEVSSVMDKLLATEDQILEARASQGLFTLIDAQAEAQIGLDSPEMREYLESYGLTEEEAARAMDLHKMRNLKDRRKEYKDIAAGEWSELQSTRAIKYAIDNGGISDVEIDLYGRDGLPKNVGLFRAGGLPLGAVANEIGVEKDELVTILRNHQKKADYIEQRTGELEQTHDNELLADEAIHNIALREQMEQESAILAKISRRERVLENRQISKYAKEQVAKMNQKEVRGVAKTVTALRRARLAANKFIKQGKYAEALEQNEKARLTEQILVEQVKARDNLEKISRRWSRIVKAIKKDPGSYSPEYRDQIAKLTERFQMMKAPLPVEERKLLFDFFAELNANVADSYEDVLDMTAGTYGTYDWLYNEEIAGSWSELAYSRVTEVDDLMKFLSKEGRVDKKDFLLDGTTRISDVVDELTQYIDGINKGKLNEFSPLLKAREFVRKYGAEQIPLQYILARMDGFKTDFSGKNIEILFNPLAKASGEQHLMLKEIRAQLDPVLEDLRKSANKFPRILLHVPVPRQFADPENSDKSLVWTFDKVLAVAMNLGNQDNTTKMLDGFGWDYQDAMNVISILSDQDLKNVQKVWDVIDTMWPEIAAMHKKIHGYTPQRVVSEEFTIEEQSARTVGNVKVPGRGPVTLKGGYYPLKFDPRQSLRQDVQNERQDILQSQDNLYPSTKTPQGFTIGRTKTAGQKPVMLSLGVLTDHINHVTHHVTHADVLTDIDKITRNSNYKKAVIDAFGVDIEKMIRPLLAHIANPRAGGSKLAIDGFLEGERSRATAYILWYNISVALKQPFSLANLAQAMGGIKSMKYIASEYRKMITRPDQIAEMIRTVHELSPGMARRAEAIDRDLQKPDKFGRLRKLSGKETVEEALEKFSDATGPVMIRMMDMVAAYPGWMAAYRQGLDKFNGDNKKAVAYADNVISATQPWDRPLDQSKVRATKAGMSRLFTMFSGYTMKYANRRAFYWEGFKTNIKTKGKSGIGPVEFMSHVLLERIAPSLVMTTMLAAVFKDEPPEAEDYLMDLLLFQFAGRYIVQDVASFAFSTAYKADSVLRTPVETGLKLAVDQSKKLAAAWEDDEMMQGTIEFFAEMLGYKYKLPVKKAAEKIEKTIEVHE